MLVVEGDAVGLIGAVLLQQLSQPFHALPGAADIGQHQHHNILFPDAAGHVLFLPGLRLFVFHRRVRRQHPGIGGDGLRGRHTHVGFVDARGGPDAILRVHAGAGSVAQRVFRKLNLHMGYFADILLRLILGVHLDQLLYVKVSVVRPGDHGRSVIAGLPSHQHRSTGHYFLPPFSFLNTASRSSEKHLILHFSFFIILRPRSSVLPASARFRPAPRSLQRDPRTATPRSL